MRKIAPFVVLLIVAFSWYWFSLRPSNIHRQCYVEKTQAIQKRHDDNLNYYFVSTTLTDLDKDTDVGKNRPMYTKDLNARLDEYWGDVAYNDCLKRNGLEN